MKLLIIALLLTGCGAYEQRSCYVKGNECASTKQGETGEDGPSGTQGVAGTDGSRGDVGASGSSGQSGAAGTAGQVGPRGDTGMAGGKGDAGDTGQAGPTGPVGPRGEAGDTIVGPAGADAIIEVIDPCGPNPDGPDEVLFRLSSGEIVAWYKNLGLSVLGDGNYITTDNQRCYFSIHNNITTW